MLQYYDYPESGAHVNDRFYTRMLLSNPIGIETGNSQIHIPVYYFPNLAHPTQPFDGNKTPKHHRPFLFLFDSRDHGSIDVKRIMETTCAHRALANDQSSSGFAADIPVSYRLLRHWKTWDNKISS